MGKKEYNYAISQNGEPVLFSDDRLSVIWNNLTGKNFQGEEYRKYIEWALCQGFKKGEIQLVEKGVVKDKFVIK